MNRKRIFIYAMVMIMCLQLTLYGSAAEKKLPTDEKLLNEMSLNEGTRKITIQEMKNEIRVYEEKLVSTEILLNGATL